MSQRTPARRKDNFLIRGEKESPGNFHIVEIDEKNRIKTVGLCGNDVDWGKPRHYRLNAVTCPSCKAAAEALELI
jgi:hypothetical protein